jgi:hypothetical protein
MSVELLSLMSILFSVGKTFNIQLNKSTNTLKDFTTLNKIGIQLNKSTNTLKDFTTLNKIGIQLNKSTDIERFYHWENLSMSL